MLLFCRNHSHYQDFIRHWLPLMQALDSVRLLSFEDSLVKMWLLNLDPAIPLLTPYFPRFGRPVKFEPVDLLRSLILMVDQKVLGITEWVNKLRSDRVLAILSGLTPGKTPGVGTFYDFINRFWLEDEQKQKERKARLRKPSRKPRQKPNTGDNKLPPRHPDIVGKLRTQIISKGRDDFPIRAERLIQKIFARCFVDPSVALGLIPNPLNLAIAGDGTSIRTGASPYGIKNCDCRQKGIFKCDCERRFGDPQAGWGWDSHRKEYFYGYMLYELTAVECPHSLPIYLRFGQTQRHDSVLGVVALAEARHIYPDLRLGSFLGDSAHDAYAYYELLKFWDVEPFIDLNTRNKGHSKCTPPFPVNEYGTPICPIGSQMVFKGHDKDRNRLKWRCPLIAGSKSVKAQISCDTPCSPSDYGRTVYTKPDDDLRLFTPTPRESEEWKVTFKMRSGSERSFSRLKKDYSIEESKIRRVRSLKAWYYRAHFAAMNQYLDAWVGHAKGKGFNIWSEVAGDTLKVA